MIPKINFILENRTFPYVLLGKGIENAVKFKCGKVRDIYLTRNKLTFTAIW